MKSLRLYLLSKYLNGQAMCYNLQRLQNINHLSHDVASESDITPCNKIDRPLVVYRFTGNVMTSIVTLRKIRENLNVMALYHSQTRRHVIKSSLRNDDRWANVTQFSDKMYAPMQLCENIPDM